MISPPPDTYDAIIFAGDIYPINYWLDDLDQGGRGITKTIPRDKPIYYVVGNHEYYNAAFDVEPLREYLTDKFPNILLLEDDKICPAPGISLHGMTMWTNFNDRNFASMSYAQRKMNDYRYIFKKDDVVDDNFFSRHAITPEHTADKHDASMTAALESFKYKDGATKDDNKEKVIIVTHHSPLPTTNTRLADALDDQKLNDAYVAQDAHILINHLTSSPHHELVAWCYGHTHQQRDETISFNGCSVRFMSNPRGYKHYREEPDFKPQGLIFEV